MPDQSDYPGALDSFVDPTDADTLDDPPHDVTHRKVHSSLVAIEGELGLNPRGTFATVRARLDDLRDSIPGGAGATIATTESTTATDFVDLATVGPDVTVTVPPSGRVLLAFGALMRNTSSGSTHGANMGVDIGASGASSTRMASVRSADTEFESRFFVAVLDGLTPGETLFRAKYRIQGSGTAEFANRHISVVTLPLPA